MYVRSFSSGLNARLASFSSSFSPGPVLVTFSSSSFWSATRLAWSMILTSALNRANTASFLIMYLNKGRLQLTWPMIRALQFGARVDSEVEVAALKQNAVCICLSGCIY